MNVLCCTIARVSAAARCSSWPLLSWFDVREGNAMVYSERSKIKQAAAAKRQAALYTMILAAVLAGGFVVPHITFSGELQNSSTSKVDATSMISPQMAPPLAQRVDSWDAAIITLH